MLDIIGLNTLFHFKVLFATQTVVLFDHTYYAVAESEAEAPLTFICDKH